MNYPVSRSSCSGLASACSTRERLAVQVSVPSDPCLDPPARALKLLPCRASHHAWGALPVNKPVEFEAQKGEPTAHARMESAETHYPRLLRRDRKVELLQPLRKRTVEPLGILTIPKSADKIIGIPAHQRLPTALGLHHSLELQHLQSPGSTGSLLRGSLAITTTGLAPVSKR